MKGASTQQVLAVILYIYLYSILYTLSCQCTVQMHIEFVFPQSELLGIQRIHSVHIYAAVVSM